MEVMSLPLTGALEMNVTGGSAWPTYTPLSLKRQDAPLFLATARKRNTKRHVPQTARHCFRAPGN